MDSKPRSDIYSSFSFHDPPLPLQGAPSCQGRPQATEHAKQIMAKACWWVCRHPEERDTLKRLYSRLMDEGGIIQQGNPYALAQRYGIEINLGSVFKREHNLQSALARYMVMERPMSLSAISFREMPVGVVPLVRYWHGTVGDNEFLAGSLGEARRIYDVQRGVR